MRMLVWKTIWLLPVFEFPDTFFSAFVEKSQIKTGKCAVQNYGWVSDFICKIFKFYLYKQQMGNVSNILLWLVSPIRGGLLCICDDNTSMKNRNKVCEREVDVEREE